MNAFDPSPINLSRRRPFPAAAHMNAFGFPGSADAAACRRSAGAYMNAFDHKEPRL